MTRTGKIARLPGQIRDQINSRIANGEPGKNIMKWLNSLDEVKTVLSEQFGNPQITPGNIHEWKQGGFRDWQAEQTAMAEARRVITHGQSLADVGKGTLGDNLATWVIGRYIMATRKLMETTDAEEGWKLLRELCHDVVALRRGEHGAEWLRIEHERLKLHRKKDAWERKKAKLESGDKPAPALSDEELDARYRQIFGMQPAETKAEG